MREICISGENAELSLTNVLPDQNERGCLLTASYGYRWSSLLPWSQVAAADSRTI